MDDNEDEIAYFLASGVLWSSVTVLLVVGTYFLLTCSAGAIWYFLGIGK